jgi:hypothetical protein
MPRGSDGSGKGDIVPAADAEVTGATDVPFDAEEPAAHDTLIAAERAWRRSASA